MSLNLTHCAVSNSHELWRELRGLGFSYCLSSRAWVASKRAFFELIQAATPSLEAAAPGEMTQEMVLRALEQEVLRQEAAADGGRCLDWSLPTNAQVC